MLLDCVPELSLVSAELDDLLVLVERVVISDIFDTGESPSLSTVTSIATDVEAENLVLRTTEGGVVPRVFSPLLSKTSLLFFGAGEAFLIGERSPNLAAEGS